jgi:hypothetical protein
MVFLERYIDEQKGHCGMFAVFKDGNSTFEPYGRCVYITRIVEIHETNNGRTGFLRRDPAFPPISRKLFIVDAFGARGIPSKPRLFQQRR